MFYVSNRKQSEYAATVANMQKLGFTGMSEKTVLLSTDTSNKQARFDAIKRAGYDIVVYAGDNLNDFGAATYHQDNAQRRAFVSENQQVRHRIHRAAQPDVRRLGKRAGPRLQQADAAAEAAGAPTGDQRGAGAKPHSSLYI